MAELEAANAELRNTAGSQAEALKLARSTLNTQRGDIDQLRGALEGEAVSSRRSTKSDATLAKENHKLNAELAKLKQELRDGRIGGNENGLLREEIGKLASQVLAVAKGQGVALPDFSRLGASPPPAEQSPRPLDVEREPFVASRHGCDGRGRESLFALSGKADDAAPEETEEEPEDTGSLGKLLSARKARRRSARGRRTGSLSERLKGLSAESPDS